MEHTTLTVMAAAVGAGVPVLVWGPPGTGKTSIIKALFPRWGYDVQVITGNIREPQDFAGLPVVQADGTVRFAPPAWAVRANAAGRALVALDELSTSTPAVQAAMLRPVLERVVGDIEMGEQVRFVAMANPPQQAADGYDLAAPLANRFLHLDVAADFESWQVGMTVGWEATLPGLESLPLVDDGLVAQRCRLLSARIAAFVDSRRTALLQVPDDATSMGRAYPTPRTWEFAALVLARIDDEAHDARLMALGGLVGAGVALEYLAWEKSADLPSPADVLADPSIYDWVDVRMDRTFAVLSSVTAMCVSKLSEAVWEQTWAVLAVAAAAGRTDLAAVAARALLRVEATHKFPIPDAAGEFMTLAALEKRARRRVA